MTQKTLIIITIAQCLQLLYVIGKTETVVCTKYDKNKQQLMDDTNQKHVHIYVHNIYLTGP